MDDSALGYCQKDARETPLDKGCRHPKDYCQFRQACMIHFLEKENQSGSNKVRGDENTPDQR